MADMTPMMRQYLEIKEQHKDSILFSAWATSTRCSMRTHSWSARSWI